MNRRMQRLLGNLLLGGAVMLTAGRMRVHAADSVEDKLVGAWRLAWDEEPDAAGKVQRSQRTGIIMYTRDHHMSVQIAVPSPDDAHDNWPIKYTQGGYEAYYGRYDIDENARTVTHHVEGALVRSLVGKDLARKYEFRGNLLVLQSSRPDEHWTIAWEHY